MANKDKTTDSAICEASATSESSFDENFIRIQNMVKMVGNKKKGLRKTSIWH